MEHWKIVRLEEIADMRGGASFPKAYQGNTEGKYPFYKVSDMNIEGNETLMQASNNWVEEDTVEILRAKLFSKDTVIFPKVGAAVHTNKKRLLSCDSLVDNNVMGVTIRDCNLCIPYYLLYWFESVDLGGFSNPGPLPSITVTTVKNAKIPLPPLPEQRAIAHILQTIQEAKATRQRELILERERKAALMDYLFSYGTKGEPRKQTEIGEIPESWEVVELGDYSELITKGSSPKWQGFDYCDEGIYFVRSQNVGLGRLELNEIAYLPEGFNKKEKKSILQKNDLLINIVGASIGRTAVADDIVEGGNVNQAVAIARLKQEVEPFFVMTFLLTLGGQVQLHKQKKDIARANLSLQDIKSLLIPLPPVSTQTEIVEILQACDTKIAALEQEAERLDELFHAMLDELMTGKRSTVSLIDVESAQSA